MKFKVKEHFGLATYFRTKTIPFVFSEKINFDFKNENNELIGILTDGDLRRLLLTRQNPLPALLVTPAIEFGHSTPTSIQGEQSITEAASLMHDKQIWDLPVVDKNKKLLGLIHRHDVN